MITAGQSTTAGCVNIVRVHACCHDYWFSELDIRSLPQFQWGSWNPWLHLKMEKAIFKQTPHRTVH